MRPGHTEEWPSSPEAVRDDGRPQKATGDEGRPGLGAAVRLAGVWWSGDSQEEMKGLVDRFNLADE